MFDQYINKKIRPDYAEIFRRELYPDTYWERGSDYLSVEVASIADEDGTWYLLVLHISKKIRGRTITGIEMDVVETDCITFSESEKEATDIFEKARYERGRKGAEADSTEVKIIVQWRRKK